MRFLIVSLTAFTLAVPAIAQTNQGTPPSQNPSVNPNAPVQPVPGTPKNAAPGATTTNPAPQAGTRALQPAPKEQNPDGTPKSQSPSNQPQLPGQKGAGN